MAIFIMITSPYRVWTERQKEMRLNYSICFLLVWKPRMLNLNPQKFIAYMSSLEPVIIYKLIVLSPALSHSRKDLMYINTSPWKYKGIRLQWNRCISCKFIFSSLMCLLVFVYLFGVVALNADGWSHQRQIFQRCEGAMEVE